MLLAALTLAACAAATKAEAEVIFGQNWSNIYTATNSFEDPQPLANGVDGNLGDLVSDGRYVYFANNMGNSIGRLRLSDAQVDPQWLPNAGEPWGVTIHGNYLYWGDFAGETIGRIGIKGKQKGKVKRRLVKKATNVYDIAVTDKYIFWANAFGKGIGRTTIDGKKRKAKFVKTAHNPCTLEIAKKKLYWGVCDGTGGIGRVNLNGKKKKNNWVKNLTVSSLTFHKNHLYWVGSQYLGKINLKNRSLTSTFVDGASWGIAVR